MCLNGSSPHVLILGAGLGGLSLAQALRKRGISFEVFERGRRVIGKAAAERMKRPPVRLHTLIMDALPGGCHAMKDGLNLARAIGKIDKGDEQSLREALDEFQ
ncbi:hypothetical protein PG994_005375 [Apiospora phragmitis]|uniref:Uncharacterized protein n=1 Tax=Apiospora phragmitis TaxID=2905665 RepID=A0ABR1VC35_9PEZI